MNQKPSYNEHNKNNPLRHAPEATPENQNPVTSLIQDNQTQS